MNQLQLIIQNGQRVLTTAQLAESYGTDEERIQVNFNRNKDRYKENKHFILLQGGNLKQFKATYQIDNQLKFATKLYLWTEKGAWLHAKSLNTDQAWDAYEMLVDEYYRIKENPKTQLEILQASINQLVDQERRLSKVETRLVKTEKKQDNINEILSLNPTEWRKKTTNLLNKIAKESGGFEAFKDVRVESYQLLEDRARCNLTIRLTNKKQKAALEGMPKSKIDKLNKMDAIADDARLTEIYLAVVKEMAVKYGVSA